jgi:hypothetical protein
MIQHIVYLPWKKNRMAAKIIPKVDKPLIMQEV